MCLRLLDHNYFKSIINFRWHKTTYSKNKQNSQWNKRCSRRRWRQSHFRACFRFLTTNFSFCMRIPNDTTYIENITRMFVSLEHASFFSFSKTLCVCTAHICDRTNKQKRESAHKCNALAKTDSICAFKNHDVNMHIAHSYHHNNKCTYISFYSPQISCIWWWNTVFQIFME